MNTPVYLTGDTFRGNTCSNGGAVGSLNSDLAIYTSSLTSNEWKRTPSIGPS